MLNRKLLLSALAGTALSLFWFKFLPVPFLGPVVAAAALALLLAGSARRESAKAALIAIATGVLTFGAAETWLWIRSHQGGAASLDYPRSYLQRDSVIGYAPAPNSHPRLRRVWGDSLVYEVVYTIDSLGLRVSPRLVGPPPAHCALFFGDSYVIGEGIPDSAAMPYRVAVRAGGRYHVYNFGVHGYGPHHMLALLETGRVKARLDCEPRYAIYEVIPAQVLRTTGRVGASGPRYRIERNGSLRRDGVYHVTDRLPPWREYLQAQLDKSALAGMMAARVRESDRRLFTRVVKESADRVARDFPDAEFHVILWAVPGTRDAWMIDRLRAEGLRVHLIGEVMPAWSTDPESLKIPHDGHPTARAQDLIAAYVVEQILRDR